MSQFAHAHERTRVNSASWYAAALLVLALFFEPRVCAVAVAVLGVGDPIAGLVGRRWGKHKLLHGRSLEGSAAFVASAFVAAFAILLGFYASATTVAAAAAIAVAAAVAGAVAEALSKRIDDNLSVPVAAAAFASIASSLV
jgi:dolichol kinase